MLVDTVARFRVVNVYTSAGLTVSMSAFGKKGGNFSLVMSVVKKWKSTNTPWTVNSAIRS